MRRFLLFYLFTFLCFTVSAPAQYVIQNVSVISMANDQMLTNHSVVVNGDKIIEVVPSKNLQSIPQGYTAVNGTDKYLIPGLAEMHAHIPVPEDGDDELVKETLFLYLANGITTIRGMLGAPYHLELKKELANKEVPSPRVYTSSPSLNGNTIPTEAEARQKVCQYAAEGYDFLKIHPGIKRNVFDVVVRSADSVGIDFSGHVPMDVGIEHAIASGYATIDHLDGYVEGLVSFDQRPEGGFFGVQLAEKADLSKINGLVSDTKKAGIAVVPTQTLMTRWLSPESAASMINQPEMKYISPSLRFSWRQNKEQLLDGMELSSVEYSKFIDIRNSYLMSFEEADVTILLGSDAPQVMNVPGFSIHREMQSMAEAGLSNFEILMSGTVSVAQFFDASDRGTIEPGKIADLVLLSASPLEDIGNAQYIEGVMYQGKWLSPDQIKEGLDKIEDKYKTE